MAVFVLGAGATRGASFVKSEQGQCLPPLDRDFFTQLQRIVSRNPADNSVIKNAVKDATEMFGNNFATTLERMFSTVDHLERMARAARTEIKLTTFKQKREHLIEAIALLLRESLSKEASLQMSVTAGRLQAETFRSGHKCDLHTKLVKEMIRKRDTIISFNYDCLIDETLRREGDGKWNAASGYGFGPNKKTALGCKKWNPNRPCLGNETVKLLKLHGSLHFIRNNKTGTLSLAKHPYEFGFAKKEIGKEDDFKFEILPPASYKSYEEGIFGPLWRTAYKNVKASEDFVFIGYSMPPADLHAEALFRIGVKKGSIRCLVVVNPDQTARQRIRNVLIHGLSSKSKVLSFENFFQFLSAGRQAWKM